MYNHLHESAIPYLKASSKEREYYVCSDRWIGYTRANEIISFLEDMLNYPRCVRMPCALIVGESGNGKSTLVEHFHNKHPARTNSFGEPVVPVVLAHMPSKANESEFLSHILYALNVAHRATDSKESKLNQVSDLFLNLNTRMLLIDEFHDLLHCTPREQKAFLAVLKKISNQLKVSIVGAGIRTSISVLHTDTQFSSRFESLALPLWKPNEEFLRMVASIERLIPLPEPSNLASATLGKKLFQMSEGTIGGLSRAIEKAAIYAFRNDQNKITMETLESIKFVKLADYNKGVAV